MSRRASPSDFDLAFDELAAVAYRVAFRILGSRGDAEDVAQEALTRAFVRWRRVRGHAEPWVARVAGNLAIDGHRRARRRPTVSDDGRAEATPVRAGGISAVDRVELVRTLADLPARQRDVVVLRYLADQSEAATAAALGTSIGSVKQHAHRGLAALRVAWTDTDDEPTATAESPLTKGTR